MPKCNGRFLPDGPYEITVTCCLDFLLPWHSAAELHFPRVASPESTTRPACPAPALSWRMRPLYPHRVTEFRRGDRKVRSVWRRHRSSRTDGLLPSLRRYLRGTIRRTACNPSSEHRSGISRSLRTPVVGQTCRVGKFLSTDWQFPEPPQTDSSGFPERVWIINLEDGGLSAGAVEAIKTVF